MGKNCSCVNIEMGSFENQIEITHHNLSRPIMVDKCIAGEIKDLLDKGVKTIGSCCGHNITYPSIIVAPESVKQMEQLGYIHGFNGCCPIGYGSNLLFFPKSIDHKGYELLEWKCIPESQFTLTAEEVELVKNSLATEQNKLQNAYIKYPEVKVYLQEPYDAIDNLLTKIKQWQDGNKKG